MDFSTPSFPVLHCLPEFAQMHVQWVGDAIQPPHPLLSPSPPAFSISQHQDLCKWVISSNQVPKVLEFHLQYPSSGYSGMVWSPCKTSLVAQMVKCLPTMRETWVRSLNREDPLEKEIATHSGTLSLLYFTLLHFWSPCSPRNSQESSLTPQFKSINSLVLSFLYGPTLTSLTRLLEKTGGWAEPEL